MQHPLSYRAALAGAGVIAGLVLPAVFPRGANIGFFLVALGAIIVLARGTEWRAAFGQPAAALPLAAGLVLGVAFVPTASSAMHLLAIGYFTPLFLIAPLGVLFAAAPRLTGPDAIAMAAGIGSALALGLGVYDVFILGLRWAGESVTNPIHFSGLALTLGFVALVGLHSPRKWLRRAVLAAPVAAVLAVMLAGSRGPLVAAVPMLVVALLVLGVQFRARLHAPLVLLGLGAVGLATMALAWQLDLLARFSAFSDAARVVLGGEGLDNSTRIRLAMLEGAYNAFLASPLYGHGLIGFTETVARYVPPGRPYLVLDHLHNDIADFAVVGGVLGLLAYMLFLLAPIAGALAGRGPGRGPAVYLASVVATGYFSMGLTNAMFGTLSLTVLYAVVSALVFALSSGPEEGSRERAR